MGTTRRHSLPLSSRYHRVLLRLIAGSLLGSEGYTDEHRVPPFVKTEGALPGASAPLCLEQKTQRVACPSSLAQSYSSFPKVFEFELEPNHMLFACDAQI